MCAISATHYLTLLQTGYSEAMPAGSRNHSQQYIFKEFQLLPKEIRSLTPN